MATRLLAHAGFAGALLMAGLLAPVAGAQAAAAGSGGGCVAIAGGAMSSWDICDDFVTSNGLPAGGSSSSGAAGSGASVDDADLGPRGDAFDDGVNLWINTAIVGGVVTIAGNNATFAQQTLSGLNTQLRYDVLTTQATLRAYLSLVNPGAAPITVTVDYTTNIGSDSGTVIRGSSSGDTVFTTADRWLVSSDANPTTGDPVNTTSIWGGTPAVTPTSISSTVYNSAGSEGVRATFSVTVPAGQTRALMFFQRLSDSDTTALATAGDFTNVAAGSPLLAGLSPAQTAAVQNFGIGGGVAAPTTAVPVGALAPWILGLLAALAGVFALRRRRTV